MKPKKKPLQAVRIGTVESQEDLQVQTQYLPGPESFMKIVECFK